MRGARGRRRGPSGERNALRVAGGRSGRLPDCRPRLPIQDIHRFLGPRRLARRAGRRAPGVRRPRGEPEQDRVAPRKRASAGMSSSPTSRVHRQSPRSPTRSPPCGARSRRSSPRLLSGRIAVRPLSRGLIRRQLRFGERSGSRDRKSIAPAEPAGGRAQSPGKALATPPYTREGEPTRGPARPARAGGPRRADSGRVLVLNASYEPLNVCTVRRAVVLVLKEKAEMVEQATRTVRSESVTLPHPVVIRLVTYVSLPRDKRRRRITRRAVFARDSWTCQYCGTGTHLTVDDVVPRSRGRRDELGEHRHVLRSLQPPQGQPDAGGDGPATTQGAPGAGPTVFIRVAGPVIPATWQQYLDLVRRVAGVRRRGAV